MSLASVVGTIAGTALGTAVDTADPVTLGLEALISFNKFLVTPPGQVFAERSQALIDKILGALHLHIAPDAPAQAAPLLTFSTDALISPPITIGPMTTGGLAGTTGGLAGTTGGLVGSNAQTAPQVPTR